MAETRYSACMRVMLLVAALALPTVAWSQDATTTVGTLGGLPLPSIGLPLPSIGLPHPPMGLPAPQTTPTQPGTDRSPTPPNGRRGRRGDHVPVVPVFLYPFFYVPPTPGVIGTSAGAPAKRPTADAAQIGRVLLDVEPGAAAQLYVDGYYVGTPDDYREGIELPAGPHALEVRAPGFTTAATSVQVPEGRTITYRASLTPSRGAKETAPSSSSAPSSAPQETSSGSSPPSEPATYYVIPGCYMGNVPPAEASLPPTCDPARAVTIRQ